MNTTWNSTAIEIPHDLSLKTRVLTLEQLWHGWFEECESTSEVEQAMEPLCQSGLVERRDVYARPMLDIDVTRPILNWKPGDRNPSDDEFRQLAEFIHARWVLDKILFMNAVSLISV